MKILNLRLRPSEVLVLPFAHMDILQGVVYKMLSFDSQLSEEIHNKQLYNRRAYKYFCFSDIKGKYHINNKRLFFHDCVDWKIRSADDRIIDTIYDYVSSNACIEIYGTQCRVSSVSISQKTLCIYSSVHHLTIQSALLLQT